MTGEAAVPAGDVDDPMRLTVVGCAGSAPGPDSAASCYLVQAGGFNLVLDLGSGALGALQRHLELRDVDAVLFSHLHADHVLDVCGLLVAAKHGPLVRTEPLPLYGPVALRRRIAAAYSATGAPTEAEITAQDDVFACHSVSTYPFSVGPFTVTARRVLHPVEAYAYRIDYGGRTLAYSGDCAPCPALETIVRGSGLALVEAGYGVGPAGPPGIHHTAADVAALAARARPALLLVTHVPPWLDRAATAAEVAASAPCPVEAARPGGVHTVGRPVGTLD